MKERPILFSAPMVRAILAGTKTQTRRVIKPQPPSVEDVRAKSGSDFSIFDDGRCHDRNGNPLWRVAGPVWAVRDLLGGKAPDGVHWRCPYGAPGDRLWVREAWRSWRDKCDGYYKHECDPHCDQTYVAYRSTPRTGYRPTPDRARIVYLDESSPIESNRRLLGPWKPSIHMPRWASRITLEVTGVRVERLQSITEEDARAEGVVAGRIPADDYGPERIGYVLGHDDGRCVLYPDERRAFEVGWKDINGAESWDANPWVWVVEFRRLEAQTKEAA